MVSKDHNPDRRKYLRTVGALSLGGALAGCTGGDGGDGGDGDTDGGDGSDGGDSTPTETPSLEERAKEEGDVAVGSSTSAMGPFINQFEEDTGINVAFFRASVAKVAARLIQEKTANNLTYDVTGGGGVQSVLEMLDEDLFAELPERTYEGTPTRVISDGRVAIPYVQWALVLLVNEEEVDTIPETAEDVWNMDADLIADVRDSELILAAQQSDDFDGEDDINQWLQNLGEKATWISSHFDAAKAAARGEAGAAIAYAKYPDYDWGGPLTIADVERWPTTAQPLQWGLVDGRPHEYAGEFYMQYHLNNILSYFKENVSETVFQSPASADEKGWWYLTAESARDVNWEQVDSRWQQQTGLTNR